MLLTQDPPDGLFDIVSSTGKYFGHFLPSNVAFTRALLGIRPQFRLLEKIYPYARTYTDGRTLIGIK